MIAQIFALSFCAIIFQALAQIWLNYGSNMVQIWLNGNSGVVQIGSTGSKWRTVVQRIWHDSGGSGVHMAMKNRVEPGIGSREPIPWFTSVLI